MMVAVHKCHILWRYLAVWCEALLMLISAPWHMLLSSHYPAVSEGLRSTQLSGQHILVLLVVIGKRRKSWKRRGFMADMDTMDPPTIASTLHTRTWCFRSQPGSGELVSSSTMWGRCMITWMMTTARGFGGRTWCWGESQRQPRRWQPLNPFVKKESSSGLGTSQARLLFRATTEKG